MNFPSDAGWVRCQGVGMRVRRLETRSRMTLEGLGWRDVRCPACREWVRVTQAGRIVAHWVWLTGALVGTWPE